MSSNNTNKRKTPSNDDGIENTEPPAKKQRIAQTINNEQKVIRLSLLYYYFKI